MLHPSPLEFSGNTCSHNCCYCFSNIRRPERYCKLNSDLNFIRKKGGTSFKSHLFNSGFSICVSNRSDALSDSNWPDTVSFLKNMNEKQNGYFIQTKGGKKQDEFFKIISGKKNIVFYVTITTINEDIRERTEPGAPSYSERMRLCEMAKAKGYPVIIAINPICEEWMPKNDLKTLISDAEKIGVTHFIFQKLHMTRSDIKLFSKNRIDRFEEEVLRKAVEKKISQAYLQDCVISLIDKGLMPLAFGMPFITNFFDEIHNTLGKSFKGNYDFFKYVNGNNLKTVYFSDYYESVKNECYELEFKGLSAYILRVARNVWKGNEKAQNVKCLKDVLKIYWNDKRISGSPQNNFLFSKIMDAGNPIVDNDGNIILHFTGTRQDERICELKNL